MLYHFKKRKYPINLLQKAFDKVRVLNRQKLLDVDMKVDDTTMEEPPIVPLLTKYYPNCDPITGFVGRNWGILQRSSTTKDLSTCRLVAGYKHTKNLRDILVHAKIKKRKERVTDQPLMLTVNKCISGRAADIVMH